MYVGMYCTYMYQSGICPTFTAYCQSGLARRFFNKGLASGVSKGGSLHTWLIVWILLVVLLLTIFDAELLHRLRGLFLASAFAGSYICSE